MDIARAHINGKARRQTMFYSVVFTLVIVERDCGMTKILLTLLVLLVMLS